MKRRNAFTLIELLVVISIIIIIASMVAGAASRAIRAGTDAKCFSNLRQIGLGVRQYMQYNGQRLPDASDWCGGGPQLYEKLCPRFIPREMFRCPKDNGLEFLGTGVYYANCYHDVGTSYGYQGNFRNRLITTVSRQEYRPMCWDLMAWHRQHTHWWRAEERAFHHTLFYDSHVERLEYQDFFKRIGLP